MKKYIIYGHYDENGNLRYIGSGTEERMSEFRITHRSKEWAKIFSSIKVEKKILFEANDEIEMMYAEYIFIKESFARGDKLANVLKGHHRLKGLAYDDEARKKMSDIKKANPTRYWLGKKRDPELIKKLTDASHTPEAIEKRRIKMIGRTLTDEHKAKISAGGIGRQHTEESRKKISDAKKGRPNGLEGKKFSEEHKLKISESRKNNPNVLAATAKIWETRRNNGNAKGYTTKRARSVICLETGEKFRCAKEAAEKMNLSDKHIQACCVGRRQRHGGYSWNYI